MCFIIFLLIHKLKPTMPTKKLLLLSSSKVKSGAWFQEAQTLIKNFLGAKKKRIVFIPYADVSGNYKAYADKVSGAFANTNYTIEFLVPQNAKKILNSAEAIMVGGGNTFKLIHDLQKLNLIKPIREMVEAGIPYIGWSAGSNIAGLSIKTTNDMPIIQPKTFDALQLVPFQINPHYHNKIPAGQNGETRDMRLQEFLLLQPNIPVVALPEGCALLVKDKIITVIGVADAILIKAGENNKMHKETIALKSNLAKYL